MLITIKNLIPLNQRSLSLIFLLVLLAMPLPGQTATDTSEDRIAVARYWLDIMDIMSFEEKAPENGAEQAKQRTHLSAKQTYSSTEALQAEPVGDVKDSDDEEGDEEDEDGDC